MRKDSSAQIGPDGAESRIFLCLGFRVQALLAPSSEEIEGKEGGIFPILATSATLATERSGTFKP